MLKNLRIACIGLLSIVSLSITINDDDLQKWQCLPATFQSVRSIVSQDSMEIDMFQNQSWIYKKRKLVNCFEKGLTRIPRGLDSDVEILNLDQNSIHKISRNDFNSYPNLTAITMVNNCIKVDFYDDTIPRCNEYLVVESEAFVNLMHLRFLALNGNVMKNLPHFSKSLSVLFASFSSLGPLTRKNFENLTSLEFAVFSANCITGDLKHYCQGNFSVDTPVFSSISALKFLDLSRNNFKQIPTYLFNHSLLGIKFSQNPIHFVPFNTFNNSTKLKYLNLAWSSQFDQIPLRIENDAFEMLTELEILELSGNRISNLPNNFLSNCTKLKSLNLAFNCLKNIETNPTILPFLPALEELYVSGNTLCKSYIILPKPIETNLTFSSAYLRFPNLTTLVLGTSIDIPGSRFTHVKRHYYLWYGREYAQVNQNSFDNLRNLTRFKKLALSFCGIRNIYPTAFNGMNLSFLDLQFNDIRFFTQNINISKFLERPKNSTEFYASTTNNRFVPLVSTMKPISPVLYLSHNSIGVTNMNLISLKYLTNTASLDLSQNEIEYVSSKTFQNFPHLQSLDLRFNPIRWVDSDSFSFLLQLSDLKLNSTSYQSNINFEFLNKVSQNLTFLFGDTNSNFYYYLNPYASTRKNFSKVIALDISYIQIPTFYISNNLKIFSSFPNLKTLMLNGARLTYDVQLNFFNGLHQLSYLHMKKCWLDNFPNAALNKLHNLVFLDLSYNKIQILDQHMFSNYSNLKTLILSHNFIRKITPGALSFLVQNGLERISLDHNQIRQLDTSIINKKTLKSLSYVDLRGNTISCDCTMSNSFGWLIRSKTLVNITVPGFLPKCYNVLFDYFEGCLRCDAPNSVKPPSLFVYSLSNNCNEEFLIVLMSSFVTLFTLFLIFSLVFTSNQFKQKLFVFLSSDIYMKFLKYNKQSFYHQDTGFAYDGFVFYDKANTEVADWIDNVMMPRLESESQSFRMCVVGRDNWCGTSPVKQLHFQIQASRKTIIVLSKGFSQTPQCRYVVSVLDEWNYQKKKKSIIVMYKNKFSGAMLQIHCRHNPFLVLRYSPGITHDEMFHVSVKNIL